jgi:hypothetical protein
MKKWIALALAAPLAASAHSWYPKPCCEEGHCKPVACNEFVTKTDSRSWGRFTWFIQFEQPSPDENCHLCIIDGYVVCAFIPKPKVF